MLKAEARQSAKKDAGKGKANTGSATPRPEGANLLWQQLATRVQTKLSVSAPDDPYEREADRVAGRVMRMPQPTVQRSCAACAAGRTACPKCEEEERERPPVIHRKPQDDESTQTSVPDEFLSDMGPGQALDRAARAFMEPRFGRDFSGVRVHADGQAAEAAHSISARAFTAGHHLAFAAGEYAPGTKTGNELLAHELTHVVQQGAGEHPLAVQRDPVPAHSSESKDEFAARVRERAATRLTQNIAVLGEWSDYINKMEGFQLRAQLLTSLVSGYAATAAPSETGRRRFETCVGTENTAERAFYCSQLDIESTYRERANNLIEFLSSMAVTGYDTTPSVAQNLQVLAGDVRAQNLPRSVHIGPDPRYSEYASVVTRFKKGEIGGCETCHEINWVWQRTIERWGSPLPRGNMWSEPLFESKRSGVRSQSFLMTTGGGVRTPFSSWEADAEIVGAWLQGQSPGNAPASQTAPRPQAATPARAGTTLTTPQASAGTTPNRFVPSAAVPQGVPTPPPRTDLCGDLPDAEDSQRIPNLDSWGPDSAKVASVIRHIDAVLTPLGPRGYRVLPHQSFDALYAVSPGNMQSVRDGILNRIRSRVQDYESLRSKILAGKVPYEELCPIVDELLPTTNEMVMWLATEDVQRWQRREKLITFLELTLLALSVMFPPSMVVTVPAGMALGLARIALGIEQRRQGEQWSQGIGAGILSTQQEAEAPGLGSRGRSNIISGLFEFGFSAVSFAGMISEQRATAELLEALQRGAVIRHAEYPGVALLARDGRLLMVTDSGQVLGYGMITADGRILWTSLSTPYSPFAGAPGYGAGAAETAIVPFGPTAIVPFGAGTPGGGFVTPFGGAPLLPSGLAAGTLSEGLPLLTPGPSGTLLGPGQFAPPGAVSAPGTPLLMAGPRAGLAGLLPPGPIAPSTEALRSRLAMLAEIIERPGAAAAERQTVINLLRTPHGQAPGALEGYVLESTLAENQRAIASLGAQLLEENPDVIVGMERGGAFLSEAVGAQWSLGPRIRPMPVHKDVRGEKFDLPAQQQEFQRLIAQGNRRIAIVESYMGGTTASALRDVLLPIARAHPDVRFNVHWMREGLGFETRTAGGDVVLSPPRGVPRATQPGASQITQDYRTVRLVLGDDMSIAYNPDSHQPITVFNREGQVTMVIAPRPGQTTRQLLIEILNLPAGR